MTITFVSHVPGIPFSPCNPFSPCDPLSPRDPFSPFVEKSKVIINDSSFVGSGPLKKIVWILCCCKDKACAFLFVLDSENLSFLSSKRRIKLRLLWHHHYCFYLLLVLLSPPTTEIIRTTHDDDDDNNTNTNTTITTNNNGTEAEVKKEKQAIKQLLLPSKQRF